MIMNRDGAEALIRIAKLYVVYASMSGILGREAPGFNPDGPTMYVNQAEPSSSVMDALSGQMEQGSEAWIVAVSFGPDDELMIMDVLRVTDEGGGAPESADLELNGRSRFAKVVRSIGQSRTAAFGGSRMRFDYVGRLSNSFASGLKRK